MELSVFGQVISIAPSEIVLLGTSCVELGPYRRHKAPALWGYGEELEEFQVTEVRQ